MKRQAVKDYHELKGAIRVEATIFREMTDEERYNYNKAIMLLLGNDFSISVYKELSKEVIASFEVKKGIVSVEIDDNLSEEK